MRRALRAFDERAEASGIRLQRHPSEHDLLAGLQRQSRRPHRERDRRTIGGYDAQHHIVNAETRVDVPYRKDGPSIVAAAQRVARVPPADSTILSDDCGVRVAAARHAAQVDVTTVV